MVHGENGALYDLGRVVAYLRHAHRTAEWTDLTTLVQMIEGALQHAVDEMTRLDSVVTDPAEETAWANGDAGLPHPDAAGCIRGGTVASFS